MLPKTIQNAINQFASLPGIGPRHATRIVLYMLKSPDTALELANNILKLNQKIKSCPVCFLSYEPDMPEQKICLICSDKKRIKSIICVINKETDIEPIEKTNLFKGVYHIVEEQKEYLHKTIQPSTKRLLERILFIKKQLPENKQKDMEIILAMSATIDGEALMIYLEKLIRPLGVKITCLGRGLATGGELEYADQQTLTNAIENRKPR